MLESLLTLRSCFRITVSCPSLSLDLLLWHISFFCFSEVPLYGNPPILVAGFLTSCSLPIIRPYLWNELLKYKQHFTAKILFSTYVWRTNSCRFLSFLWVFWYFTSGRQQGLSFIKSFLLAHETNLLLSYISHLPFQNAIHKDIAWSGYTNRVVVLCICVIAYDNSYRPVYCCLQCIIP